MPRAAGGAHPARASSGAAGARQLPHTLVPGSLFTTEKLRGAAVSVVSGGAANGLNLLAVQLGLSPLAATALILGLFGALASYTLDIVFAKRAFRLPGAPHVADVPYDALALRARLLLRSFRSQKFVRFLVVLLLDIVAGVTLLRATIAAADSAGLLVGRPWRDAALASLVALFNFLLFSNMLRFDWAYQDDEQAMTSLVVLMTVTLAVLLFASTVASPAPASPATVGAQ